MKKQIIRLFLASFLILMMCGSAAAQEEYDTIYLTQNGINVKVLAERNTILDQDGFYYVFAGTEGKIPYVMFGEYRFTQNDFFQDGFTEMMKNHYTDLTIAEEEETITVGDYEMQKIVYNYSVSGFQMVDTRLAARIGDYVIMFGSKEIPELNQMVGDLLTEVAEGLQNEEWDNIPVLQETK